MFSNLLDITGFFVGILINLLLIALICFYFKRKIDNLECSQSEQAKTLYTILASQSSITTQSNSTNQLNNGLISGLDLSQLNEPAEMIDDSDSDSESESESDNDSESDKEEVAQSLQDPNGEQEQEDEEESEFQDEEEEEETQEGASLHTSDAFKLMKLNTTDVIDDTATEPILSSDIKEIDYNNDVTRSENTFTEQGMTNIMNNEHAYDKMTVKELKNIFLLKKGVAAKSSMNKSEIINSLMVKDIVQ